ncbi:phenylalanine--tRNA ligase subunit beta [Iodobacter fluviatilis]|uniref:Phenylalanine--tRNA ligase beta subunit n=1 Tax=Iodobacter fluviatilis TaxID=537 RepID=A0A377Q268_9NEIS|nr:phenylalanine--tRNA ligase subunit beta [Iodobacter fluviatilis]TCU90237.1 phenylalanyl-tRNA synthetase beta subunit [Iodobacter fluviatilis]STQ89264.1 Phenylalanine--tRNA ligase beta subunit [Iodobacter fluviatilis]
MKFSEQWLRSWVNPALNSEQLAHLLTMAGLEVEENDPAAPEFTQVFVAEVLSVTKHENADKLNVCSVNVGEAEPLQIVCGAPNVAPGIKVPCARVGAALPGDFNIKKAKVRGVESFGMLCSGDELGMPSDVDGLMILPSDAPVGMPIREYLQLDDRLLTLKLTPNRTDCLSIKGIAREVAALTDAVLNPVEINAVVPACDDVIAVALNAGAACPRYAGRVIKNVNQAADTPDWMKQRLERSGLRSISAIVDVTNYVLLELGQPMHAFDADKLQGGIQARFAQQGEKITLLNEKELTLDADMLVIADEAQPLALAGIMGGLASSVVAGTQNIFLESAFFAPATIAGRSRRVGFSSDSSHRFERGIDFANVVNALERATQLILEICGGEAGPVTEAKAELPARPAVTLRVSRVAKVLGIQLSADEILALLARLALPTSLAGDVITVTPPSFRFDIEIEEDLIEEIARLFGYDNIPVAPSASRQVMLPQQGDRREKAALKSIMVARDYFEAISYAFVEEKWEADFAGNISPVKLLNPIASQMSVMRSSLFGGLISALQGNQKRKQERVRLFELARVFNGTAADAQPEKIAGLAWGHRSAEQWGVAKQYVDFYDVKADVEALLAPRKADFRRVDHPALHPGRAAEVLLNGIVVGVIGELHPKWVQSYDLGTAPVLFELDVEALVSVETLTAKPVSKLQVVRRDLALLADESLSVATLQAAFAKLKNPLLIASEVFDVYRGKGVPEGKKSLAFKMLMQDTHKTLTDEEVDAVVADMIRAAEASGATLRV